MVPLKNIGGLEYGPMCVLVKMTSTITIPELLDG